MTRPAPDTKRRSNAAPSPPEGTRGERGSAFLITAMVTAILALMGFSFLVLSETEHKIASNRKDGLQVLSVAESGVNLVVTWFNNPDPAKNALLPSAANVVQNLRVAVPQVGGVALRDQSARHVHAPAHVEHLRLEAREPAVPRAMRPDPPRRQQQVAVHEIQVRCREPGKQVTRREK